MFFDCGMLQWWWVGGSLSSCAPCVENYGWDREQRVPKGKEGGAKAGAQPHHDPRRKSIKIHTERT